MAILIDDHTRLVVQGITGREGQFHTLRNRAYGTNVVAGVTPGKGGQDVEGIPVFDTVAEAVERTGANTSLIFVPARFAAGSVYEAADAGVGLAVCITEGIPVLDMVKATRYLKGTGTVLIGPNCPGLISPGKANVGIIPGEICAPGNVGLISRSGTLTYQIVGELTARGMGQSTCVGMGGDPVHGIGFVEALERFEADPQTEAVALIGEIGGSDEERAAEFVRDHLSKPVVAYVAGFSAPPGKRMGHGRSHHHRLERDRRRQGRGVRGGRGEGRPQPHRGRRTAGPDPGPLKEERMDDGSEHVHLGDLSGSPAPTPPPRRVPPFRLAVTTVLALVVGAAAIRRREAVRAAGNLRRARSHGAGGRRRLCLGVPRSLARPEGGHAGPRREVPGHPEPGRSEQPDRPDLQRGAAAVRGWTSSAT